MPSSSITGGKPKRKTASRGKKKTASRGKKKTAARGKKKTVSRGKKSSSASGKKSGTRRGKTMEQLQRAAKAKGIPLSKDGHKKTKEQLSRALAYRKAHKKR